MAKVRVLVIGGGGAGWSGGGGAGGYVHNAAFSVFKRNYDVQVGNGGGHGHSSYGYNGGDSVFDTITALGGGGGASHPPGGTSKPGRDGACGGGAAGGGTIVTGGIGSQGGDGGDAIDPDRTGGLYAGGGGGASQNGQNAEAGIRRAGNGGNGIKNNISGQDIYYAGGGGAGAWEEENRAYGGQGGGGNGGYMSINGEKGTDGLGGGGGGGSSTSGAGEGGSGVVIIRYKTADFGVCIGGTKKTIGEDTIHTFTSNGTFVCNPKPDLTTEPITDLFITNAKGNGTIVDTQGQVVRRGFCYKEGISGDPTIDDGITYEDGNFSEGTFSKTITGLKANTFYRVRAYAVNEEGVGYGNTIQIKTLGVETENITQIKITEATGNAEITASIQTTCSRRGFCYKEGISDDPTINDDTAYEDGNFNLGSYSKIITGLKADTYYRIRAYIKDENDDIAYGETEQIKTLEVPKSSGSFIMLLK